MAQAATSTESVRRCEACRAPVTFDPATGGLHCDYCGAKRPIVSGATVPLHPLSEALVLSGAASREGLQVAACTNCGAQTEIDAAVASTTCAFCSAALEVRPGDPVTPAEGVVPFEITRDAAGTAFSKWVRKLWFRPNDLKHRAKVHDLRGAYVPAWLFHAHAESSWTAEAGYHYYEEETREIDGKTQTVRVQKTRWEYRSGYHDAVYRNQLVSASKGVPADELARVEPYELTKALRTFDADYLAGFEAETHGLDAATCWEIARTRIEAAEHDACAREVPGDTYRNLQVSTTTSREQLQSTLVPLWVAAFEYRSKLFRFVVNGQTGKVAGQAPWSVAKIVAAVFVGLVVAGAVAWWVMQQQ